jgi:hypothetical protein
MLLARALSGRRQAESGAALVLGPETPPPQPHTRAALHCERRGGAVNRHAGGVGKIGPQDLDGLAHLAGGGQYFHKRAQAHFRCRNLYGTTYDGVFASNATLFRITLTGALTTLYSFCSTSGCPDGANPWAALLQDTNGKFYGTT